MPHLTTDPDGTLDCLRTWLNRVKDHPDLGGQIRDGLTTRLQTACAFRCRRARLMKLNKQDVIKAARRRAGSAIVREQERKTFEDRVESQFRVYKNLMTRPATRNGPDGRHRGGDGRDAGRGPLQGLCRVPVAAKAMYDIALAAYPLQQHQTPDSRTARTNGSRS